MNPSLFGPLFRGLLNDLKRRPEDAARELNLTLETVEKLLEGKMKPTLELIEKVEKTWPVNARDLFPINNDTENGIVLFSQSQSAQSARTMDRAGKPYYEYRDTAMSRLAKFRPEWIQELHVVSDNDPTNPTVQWNNGHFMHQFTYFIGSVNFYFIDPHTKEKKVAVMNTGDSMYISPFVPHTFATRKEASERGLILALTYGESLSGDAQKELAALGVESSSSFLLATQNPSSFFEAHLERLLQNSMMNFETLADKIPLNASTLRKEIQSGPLGLDRIRQLAQILQIQPKDLMTPEEVSPRVVVNTYSNQTPRQYLEDYKIVDLAGSPHLPYSKAFEFSCVDPKTNPGSFFQCSLHQYAYVLEEGLQIEWKHQNKTHRKLLNRNDSFYLPPFTEVAFSGHGKILIFRIAGNMRFDQQIELSSFGKANIARAVGEGIQWFNPEGHSP